MRLSVMAVVVAAVNVSAGVASAQASSGGVKAGVVWNSLRTSGVGAYETSADPGPIGGVFLAHS